MSGRSTTERYLAPTEMSARIGLTVCQYLVYLSKTSIRSLFISIIALYLAAKSVFKNLILLYLFLFLVVVCMCMHV